VTRSRWRTQPGSAHLVGSPSRKYSLNASGDSKDSTSCAASSTGMVSAACPACVRAPLVHLLKGDEVQTVLAKVANAAVHALVLELVLAQRTVARHKVDGYALPPLAGLVQPLEVLRQLPHQPQAGPHQVEHALRAAPPLSHARTLSRLSHSRRASAVAGTSIWSSTWIASTPRSLMACDRGWLAHVIFVILTCAGTRLVVSDETERAQDCAIQHQCPLALHVSVA
jgi:hypothetical protein